MNNPFDFDCCTRSIHYFAMTFMRRVFWEAQGGQCGICRGRMKRSFSTPKLTFDHVWPKAWAAHAAAEAKYLGNLLLAHASCNKAKRDERPRAEQVEFLHEVNRKLGLLPHETAIWDTLDEQAAE